MREDSRMDGLTGLKLEVKRERGKGNRSAVGEFSRHEGESRGRGGSAKHQRGRGEATDSRPSESTYISIESLFHRAICGKLVPLMFPLGHGEVGR